MSNRSMGIANNFPFCSRQTVLMFKRLWFAKRCESTMVNVLVIEYWWTRKKPILPLFRHSGESRNPVNSTEAGCRIKSGMTIRGFFQNHQYWNLGFYFPFKPSDANGLEFTLTLPWMCTGIRLKFGNIYVNCSKSLIKIAINNTLQT
jgi:hypothetical protein